MWKWLKSLKGDFISIGVVVSLCLAVLLFEPKKVSDEKPVMTLVVQTTEYSALDDGLRPGQKGFNLTFCGETPIPDSTCAIDPAFWSEQFHLSYDKKWKQEKRAQAEIFKRLVLLVEDKDGRVTAWKANDVGGKIRKGHLDFYVGKDEVARKKARSFGSQYRKIYAFLKFDD